MIWLVFGVRKLIGICGSSVFCEGIHSFKKLCKLYKEAEISEH